MNKILVANRGEIALRVMKTCKDMGIKTVAVFSEADRTAPFVRYADEAVCIGPGPSSESYLLGSKIIQVALELGVEGIHPGYGFLSENALFAKQVTAAGIKFIGPLPESMEVMGDKLAAKKAVSQFDIPMVPGTDEAVEDIEEAKKIAEGIGFPILVKAAAGGGGKGMRVVENSEEFEEQLQLAVGEATSAFGDGSVFIEKYVGSPRHIEIQIMADTHGNIVYLAERDCSVQRRHQKVVEEAPSSVLSAEKRQEMGECAVRVAKACNYRGAGTVEFLYDQDGSFYFLEMNTRLQVEHPVTEMITGIDLVREQINVANGHELSFSQNDITINGHSFEVRVYAEDSMNNFMPAIGKLIEFKSPEGPGIRVDSGFESGMDIPIFYDSMISKLITYGNDREEARKRMLRAIDDYVVVGVPTTLPFCKFTLEHPAFISGDFDTKFVDKYYNESDLISYDASEEMIAAMVGTLAEEGVSASNKPMTNTGTASAWKLKR